MIPYNCPGYRHHGRIEAELGLTGSPEEEAQIAKLQAIQRGKAQRKAAAGGQVTAEVAEADAADAAQEDKILGELGMTKEEGEAAALKIQAMQRGKLARRAQAGGTAEAEAPAEAGAFGFTGSEDEMTAAQKIQAMQRGKLARREMDDQSAAATKMQAVQRGKAGRKSVSGRKTADELGLTGSEEETAAAAKIQATQRGKKTRREMVALKN